MMKDNRISVTVADGYRELTGFVESLPRTFSSSGEVIYRGRNEIRSFRVGGETLVVKRFKRLGLFKQMIYCVRSSKASRAYHNAFELLERGVFTPAPVAYVEVKNCLGLPVDTYYISAYTDMQPVASGLREGAGNMFNRILTKDFACFVATLHEKGVMHLDLNGTNVVYTPSPEGGASKFGLIDINRMEFAGNEGFPFRECAANLARFSSLSPLFWYFVDCYVWCRYLPKSAVGIITVEKCRHDSFVNRKKKLKRQIARKRC